MGTPDHEKYYGEQSECHEWMSSIYGETQEELPPNMPTPLGKPVRLTTFVDANLMHNLTTGRSATGILHMLNQTPLWWFSKQQRQVETVTYGSEFVAALVNVGVPLDRPAWLFGDNQSVITQSTIPHLTLSKWWNPLSYHQVREAILAGYVRFHNIHLKHNPADILIKPLLFWKGDTDPTVKPTTPSHQRGVSAKSDAQVGSSQKNTVCFKTAHMQYVRRGLYGSHETGNYPKGCLKGYSSRPADIESLSTKTAPHAQDMYINSSEDKSPRVVPWLTIETRITMCIPK